MCVKWNDLLALWQVATWVATATRSAVAPCYTPGRGKIVQRNYTPGRGEIVPLKQINN